MMGTAAEFVSSVTSVTTVSTSSAAFVVLASASLAATSVVSGIFTSSVATESVSLVVRTSASMATSAGATSASLETSAGATSASLETSAGATSASLETSAGATSASLAAISVAKVRPSASMAVVLGSLASVSMADSVEKTSASLAAFKRDRAPFVLTSDMAYVINGGERPTSRFQLFVDLCSQAYNLIRKHSGLFLNLLSLMTSSGLPELTGSQDLKYVFDALQPHNTDAEATIFFTRLIESSLGSVATKFNFFIHNLAQLRFSGLPANDEPILSFSPKTYTLKQEGRIIHASIFSFQKRYNPDKHYTYVVRLLREGQNEPQFLFRTFDEFQELHNKLSILFPLWKLPSFPNKMVLGRTHIKEVAAKRKLELNNYTHNLMRSSTEVTQCDLVYTFFHPIARDDKTDGLPKVPEPPLSPTSGRVEGEVKLSISYRNSNLFIMVMHIRDLVSEDGTDPNPYVKTYLLPDPHKTSKRKTKISRKTRNPTFNEMLVYSGYSKETLGLRELQLSVLSAESLRENYFLGGITLRLKDFDLTKETVKWYKLTAVPYF